MQIIWTEIADGEYNERQAVVNGVMWYLYSDSLGNDWYLDKNGGLGTPFFYGGLDGAIEAANLKLSDDSVGTTPAKVADFTDKGSKDHERKENQDD